MSAPLIPPAVGAALAAADVSLRWSASGPPSSFIVTATLGNPRCHRAQREGRGATMREATIAAVGSLRSRLVAESARVGAAGDVQWRDLYAADAEKVRALVVELTEVWT